MSLDERLRERIPQFGRSIEPDIDSALGRALGRGRRVRVVRAAGQVLALAMSLVALSTVLLLVRQEQRIAPTAPSRSLTKLGACENFHRAEAGWPAVSADGRIIAFEATPGVVVCGSGRPILVTRHEGNGFTCVDEQGNVSAGSGRGSCLPSYGAITATPDGRRVFFDSYGQVVPGPRNPGKNVYVLDVERRKVSRVTVAGPSTDDYWPALASNGRQLEFYRRTLAPAPSDSPLFVTRVRLDLATGAIQVAAIKGTGAFHNATRALRYKIDGDSVVFNDAQTGLSRTFDLPHRAGSEIDFVQFVLAGGRWILQPVRVDRSGPVFRLRPVPRRGFATELYEADGATGPVRRIKLPSPLKFAGLTVPSPILLDGRFLVMGVESHATFPARHGAQLYWFDIASGDAKSISWNPPWWYRYGRALVLLVLVILSAWSFWAWKAIRRSGNRSDWSMLVAVLLLITAGLAWRSFFGTEPIKPLIVLGGATLIAEAVAPHPRPLPLPLKLRR